MKKLIVTSTVLVNCLLSPSSFAKTDKQRLAEMELKEKRMNQIIHNLDDNVVCPNFKYNTINICKDELNGNICYYVVSDTRNSVTLSCVPNKYHKIGGKK